MVKTLLLYFVSKDVNSASKVRMFTASAELEPDGKTHKVLARDVQLHPVLICAY